MTDISDLKKGLERVDDKVGFLKKELNKPENSYQKPEITSLLVDAIKEKSLVKLDTEDPVQYKILYDSIGEGAEPIYFWLLDFLRSPSPTGLGLSVSKSEEGFEASASSAYFGEMGQRASVMQDRAISLMERIHMVVRTIINLIYDLKEFKIRLDSYEEIKSDDKNKREAAELSLKGVWMDQVDIKQGRGSINGLSTLQGSPFTTLRDAFLVARSLKDITDKKEGLDLNDRVRRILSKKYAEYEKWRNYSEKELRKRYNIEKNYLRAQVNSLKIYTKWVRPYLKAASKLGMKDFNSPDIVTAFNNMELHLTLIGKKLIKPTSVFKDYKDIKNGYFACVWADIKFVSIPQAYRGQSGSNYIHGGKTEINLSAYVFSEEDMKLIEKQETNEDFELAESLTNISLKELAEDIDSILSENKPKKESQKKQSFQNPLGNPFKGLIDTIKDLNKGISSATKPSSASSFKSDKVKKEAQDKAKTFCFTAYNVYKKTHGMIAW